MLSGPGDLSSITQGYLLFIYETARLSDVVCLCLYAYLFRDTFLVVKLGE